jgi:DNA-binding IclR family transcriptional regulator
MASPYNSAVENDTAQPQSYIASIDHALRLLLMLKVQPRIRVADAADELGVARSTAHRVLGMLVYRGFAIQDPGSRAYRAGPVLVEVGMGALAQLDVRQRARPYLERVAAQTGETTSLQILDGTQARFVDSVESVNAVRVGSRAGVSLPAHIASGGKAMLACMSDRALLTLYPSEDLGSPLTPRRSPAARRCSRSSLRSASRATPSTTARARPASSRSARPSAAVTGCRWPP